MRWKHGLAGVRPESLAAPTEHRREPDDADRPAVEPPHMLDGLAETGGRIDRSVRDEAPSLAQLRGADGTGEAVDGLPVGDAPRDGRAGQGEGRRGNRPARER